MDLREFHRELKEIEQDIEARGLNATVEARINYCGDQIAITVGANEPYDANGYWSSSRDFDATPGAADMALEEARSWVMGLPSAEDRAIEMMLKKLNLLAEQLPKGGNEIAQVVWAEIHKMLMAKADQLAKNGLPSPARIQQIKEAS